MSSVDVPHFAYPFRLAGSTVAVNEQDTDDDIRDCVTAILLTPQGARVELPDFGNPDQTFTEGGADSAAVELAVEEWEPRAAARAAANNESLGDYISEIAVNLTGGS